MPIKYTVLLKTILISGATGLIGTHIFNALKARGDNAIIISMNISKAKARLENAKAYVTMNDLPSLANESIDGVINLAGKNLGNTRWNEKSKKEMYDSRINTTRKLVEFISSMKNKPEVLVSASGVDYYGNTGDKEINEGSPIGTGFLSELTRDWEAEALKAELAGIRVVCVRTAFVVAENNDGLQKMALPYRFYVGGTAGSGEQYMSWIHIDDIRDIYFFAIDNKNLKGSVNASAPNPVKMKEFSKNIGKVLKRPSSFKVPEFALKLIFGEQADVIINGRKALPEKLLEHGYDFRYKNVFDALKKELK
jgi:uncharacterized protein (TIGR01777 family)